MPLIGALPQPITSAPLVILIYLVLILMIVSALTSVLVRDRLWAIGAFSASMVLIALLYLTIAPFLLVAVQLLVFTTVSAALLVGLLRQTTGLGRSTQGALGREWIIGAAVAAALLALLEAVIGITWWPVRICCSFPEDFWATLTNIYPVGLTVLVVVLASAALGSGLLLAAPTLPSPRGGGSAREGGPRR